MIAKEIEERRQKKMDYYFNERLKRYQSEKNLKLPTTERMIRSVESFRSQKSTQNSTEIKKFSKYKECNHKESYYKKVNKRLPENYDTMERQRVKIKNLIINAENLANANKYQNNQRWQQFQMSQLQMYKKPQPRVNLQQRAKRQTLPPTLRT